MLKKTASRSTNVRQKTMESETDGAATIVSEKGHAAPAGKGTVEAARRSRTKRIDRPARRSGKLQPSTAAGNESAPIPQKTNTRAKAGSKLSKTRSAKELGRKLRPTETDSGGDEASRPEAVFIFRKRKKTTRAATKSSSPSIALRETDAGPTGRLQNTKRRAKEVSRGNMDIDEDSPYSRLNDPRTAGPFANGGRFVADDGQPRAFRDCEAYLKPETLEEIESFATDAMCAEVWSVYTIGSLLTGLLVGRKSLDEFTRGQIASLSAPLDRLNVKSRAHVQRAVNACGGSQVGEEDIARLRDELKTLVGVLIEPGVESHMDSLWRRFVRHQRGDRQVAGT